MTTKKVYLEPESQQFADATSKPPFLADLGPIEGRKVVDEVQNSDEGKLPVDIEDLIIKGGPSGEVSIRIVRPKNAPAKLPPIVYTHGAGWVFGNNHTHDRLIREIAVGAQVALVFTNYSLSPEVRYPTAIEEIYAVTKWVAEEGHNHGMIAEDLIIAGDSVGGNMTIAVSLMAKERKGPDIKKLLVFYPVTDASFDTESYKQFAEGYFLRRDGMQWFWDQYITDPKQREEITASPLRATIDQLKGLPESLIITGEADVLRDEGEAYANKLREAGVRVAAARIQGALHDFVMLNTLKDTAGTRAAMLLAISWLRQFTVKE